MSPELPESPEEPLSPEPAVASAPAEPESPELASPLAASVALPENDEASPLVPPALQLVALESPLEPEDTLVDGSLEMSPVDPEPDPALDEAGPSSVASCCCAGIMRGAAASRRHDSYRLPKNPVSSLRSGTR